jgi:hypothetical protein
VRPQLIYAPWRGAVGAPQRAQTLTPRCVELVGGERRAHAPRGAWCGAAPLKERALIERHLAREQLRALAVALIQLADLKQALGGVEVAGAEVRLKQDHRRHRRHVKASPRAHEVHRGLPKEGAREGVLHRRLRLTCAHLLDVGVEPLGDRLKVARCLWAHALIEALGGEAHACGARVEVGVEAKPAKELADGA